MSASVADKIATDRLTKLVQKGDAIPSQPGLKDHGAPSDRVDPGLYIQWQAQSLSALIDIFGAEDNYVTSFRVTTEEERLPIARRLFLDRGLGVLRAALGDVESGWTQHFQEIVHAEVFDDFLEMATFLISEHGLKDPAAVIAGTVLEEHLRKLGTKHGLPSDAKVATLNEGLWKAGVFTKPRWRQVQAWYDLRSSAAHAKFGEYDQREIELMIVGIRDLIAQLPA